MGQPLLLRLRSLQNADNVVTPELTIRPSPAHRLPAPVLLYGSACGFQRFPNCTHDQLWLVELNPVAALFRHHQFRLG